MQIQRRSEGEKRFRNITIPEFQFDTSDVHDVPMRVLVSKKMYQTLFASYRIKPIKKEK